MRYPHALLARLADGQLHSGAAIAASLGVSRAAISKQVAVLGRLGVAVSAVRGRGYRLAAPLTLLDAASIEAVLAPPIRARLRTLRVLTVAGSTNSELLAGPPPPADRIDVLIAESQTGGRGRRGRAWLAPFGSSLLMSLGVVYPEGRSDLSGVTLAVGVALARALDRAGVRGLSLKWPNDVEFAGEKLAGVLCELKVEAGGAAQVVVGVGLNVSLGEPALAALSALGRRAADLTRIVASPPPRALLAALLIEEIVAALSEFGRSGLASFLAQWRSLDALAGREVTVEVAGTTRNGVARGLAPDGALLVDYAGTLERVDAGEVTLRLAS